MNNNIIAIAGLNKKTINKIKKLLYDYNKYVQFENDKINKYKKIFIINNNNNIYIPQGISSIVYNFENENNQISETEPLFFENIVNFINKNI